MSTEVRMDEQTECAQCYAPIATLTSRRCENCLGCIDGSRCYDAPSPLCSECDALE